jgi:hypothetical protein
MGMGSMMPIQIRHKRNFYFSVIIFVIYFFHLVILSKPFWGILDVLLIALSYFCFVQVSFYREGDNKKWAIFSLVLLLTVFFFLEVVAHILQQIGISRSDDEKLLVQSAILLFCVVFCFYKKKIRDYCQVTFDLFPTLVILLSLALSTYILRNTTEYSLPLLSDERLCQLTLVGYILFSISWWIVLTLSSILINSLTQYRWIAVFLITCFLIGFAAIPLSGWFLIGYFFILSLVTILKRNFLYMYIGGIMINTIEILFFC